ncbi:mps one binder kinase activator-like 1B-like protein, partial [Conidiobolus coronatus NRRL 28638]
VFDFVTNINLILSVISEYCTVETCPRMSANNTIYNYLDNQQKVQKLPACQFIDYTLTNIQNIIDNEQNFPTKQGAVFSQNFTQLTREICLNLFKIFAHLLTTHYDQFHQLQFLPYFNSIFYHFLSFVKKFNLIDRRELTVCDDLIKELEVNELIC